MSLIQVNPKNIVLRILLYLGLAFAFLGVCGLLVFLSVRTGVTDLGRWIFLAVYTVVFGWVMVRPSKALWRRPAFWLVVGGLLALHLLGFVAVLRYYPQWRPVWYIPVIIVEAALFGSILGPLFKGRTESLHR